MFLEISQNSHGNTCARVSFFNKIAGLRDLFRDHLQISLLMETISWKKLTMYKILMMGRQNVTLRYGTKYYVLQRQQPFLSPLATN